MGEYATRKSDGVRIKIGTCEDMMYLRWDQAGLVEPESGSVDPIADREGIRFRFPFPNEDNIAPGEFEDYDRGIAVPDAEAPTGLEHYPIQFTAYAGYNLCLPCPESGARAIAFDGAGEPKLVAIHRNGFSGAVKVVQQRWWNGQLVTVCECGGCHARYRLETLADAEPIAVALRSKADQLEREHQLRYGDDKQFVSGADFWHKMADRMLAGYEMVDELAPCQFCGDPTPTGIRCQNPNCPTADPETDTLRDSVRAYCGQAKNSEDLARLNID